VRSVNKVILIGHLGRDPEKKYTSSETPRAITKFTLATNESWNDRDGNRQERTEWHRVVVWGRLAEICAEYLSKGRQVYVEGRLQTRNWDDDQGNKRYITEVVADNLVFLGRGEGGGGDGYQDRGSSSSGGGRPSSGGSSGDGGGKPSSGGSSGDGGGKPSSGGSSGDGGGGGFNDDDIPF
jgi:single-strand DNA-binding protein